MFCFSLGQNDYQLVSSWKNTERSYTEFLSLIPSWWFGASTHTAQQPCGEGTVNSSWHLCRPGFPTMWGKPGIGRLLTLEGRWWWVSEENDQKGYDLGSAQICKGKKCGSGNEGGNSGRRMSLQQGPNNYSPPAANQNHTRKRDATGQEEGVCG